MESDLGDVFGHLVVLLPPQSVLCLAASWSEEGREFLRAHEVPDPPMPPLPREFFKAQQIPIDAQRMG